MFNSTSLLTSRLSLMMFLQFFLWGSWFATLGQCLGSNDFADIIGGAYGTSPLGAIFAPLFLGLIADRFFPSSKLCSDCGHKVEKMPLSIRKWSCDNCKSNHDRDINAAINLKNCEVSFTVKACGYESPG